MAAEKHNPNENGDSDADADLQREILLQRKFTLAEAIGRLGGDMLKGTSPVTGRRQAELIIERFLESNLRDSEGALLIVLKRTIRQSDILMKGYEQPLDALARNLERLLSSEYHLRRFVDKVDTEWGRLYSERPYREIEGQPAAHDDPYTVVSVEKKLSGLLQKLAE